MRGSGVTTAALTATASQLAAPATQMVQFVFVAPDANSVSLVGDFNDWNAKATPLRSLSGNLWSVEVPLAPGRYNYIFMVDGTRMVADPAAPRAPADEFGQTTSVVTVGSSSE
jgi:1,4-alpha-glucan branching enzyme